MMPRLRGCEQLQNLLRQASESTRLSGKWKCQYITKKKKKRKNSTLMLTMNLPFHHVFLSQSWPLES